MRYKSGQKEETHQKMISAADKTFRAHGFHGVGVDGLAKSAGVTSGAFYKHFSSKAKAFDAALETGIDELQQVMLEFKERHGDEWWLPFARFYVQEKRICPPEEACALQSLSAEVMRAGENTRSQFTQQLQKLAKVVSGSNRKGDQQQVLVKLAMLAGAVTLARSVNDPKLSKQIAEGVLQQFERC